MKRALLFLVPLLAALLSGAIVSGNALAVADFSESGTVTSAPDNGCPTAWARDTFTRVTEFTQTEPGVYDIVQSISGTWVSTADPAIHGTITGSLSYTVTGTLLPDISAVDDDVDLSAYACKSDVPQDSFDRSTRWALRYFEEGAVAGPLTSWEYVYDTDCTELFVENDSSDPVSAATFPTPCAPPTTPVTTPATQSPEPSATTTTTTITITTGSTTTNASPSTSTTAAIAAQLPVTGPGLRVILAGAVLFMAIGVGFILLSRRRRYNG